MRSRVWIAIVAVVLGVIAAFAVFSYLNGVQRAAEAGSTMTDVLVAVQDIPRGTLANDLLSSGAVQLTKMPLRYIPSGGISSLTGVADQVLAVPVTKGEVLTTSRFQYPSEAGLSFNVPEGFVAVTIPVDEARGVAGLVKPGDRVAVLATVQSKQGQNETGYAVDGARVLAVGQSTGTETQSTSSGSSGGVLSGGSSSDASVKTVTLAVPPNAAGKLVFAAENSGRVWLTLLPTTASNIGTATALFTADTVLR